MTAQRSMENDKKRIRAMITSLTTPHNSGNTFNVSTTKFFPHPHSSPIPPGTSHLLYYGPGSIAE